MLKLTIFNFLLLTIITALLIVVKKTIKSEKAKSTLLLAASLITILFHYSTLIFRTITGNDAIAYIGDNANLILPIYPCNVVMWSSVNGVA